MKIFIGYDIREKLSYHTTCHSIMMKTTIPVEFIPLIQSHLRDRVIYTREVNPLESTEFSFTRFLVPYLSGYEGISLFMDCDMVVKGDLGDLHIPEGDDWAVACCHHDYTPKDTVKFLGNTQTAYPRKNWSSFMLFNNANCKVLTPEYVNSASGLELHRFLWTTDDKVRPIPLEWNWLVGEYDVNSNAKVLHYTNGGPWFHSTENCDHAQDWRDVVEDMQGV